jgi:large subunit ribosomal protein L35
MPKMKTHRGTKKRVKATGSGRLMREQTHARHKLEAKSSRRTRRLAGDLPLSPADSKNAKRLLGL